MEIAISEFKAKCLQLLKTTAETGEELVVTLRGKPLARVSPILPTRERVLGAQPGAIHCNVNEDDAWFDSDLEDDWDK